MDAVSKYLTGKVFQLATKNDKELSCAVLEEALQWKSGNPNARLAEYVDVAIGTAVGGMTAALLLVDGGTGFPGWNPHVVSTTMLGEPPLASFRGGLYTSTDNDSNDEQFVILEAHQTVERTLECPEEALGGFNIGGQGDRLN
ncbi:hypothetical protein SUGI_0054430 [Cryptomeria japonica]|nr:hypothetical protein SUGI_0054430 [Cryptomeria japonica]